MSLTNPAGNAIALQQALRAHPEQAAYWREQRRTWAEPTVLVRDHLRKHTGDTPHVRAAVPAGTAAAADALTGNDPTLRRVLAGAVLALLAARATDRRDVTLFLPTDTTPVPVTVPVHGDDTGRGLLTALRSRYLDALAHLDVPVTALLEHEGDRPGDLMLTLDGQHTPADAERAGCTLLLDVRADAVTVHYDPRLFAEATAQRLAGTYAELLTGLLADTAAPLAPALAANDAERDLVTGAFNRTDAPFPDTRTLHSFLEERAATTPDAVAIADDGTTYGELNAAANRLAQALRSRGTGAGDVVGVCLPRSPRMLVAIYAILKAGGAYLPVDPTLPRNRIDYILEHSGTTLIVSDTATCDVVAGHEVVDVAASAGDTDPGDPEPVSGPDDLAYVIYTSGSTGRPKGVMIEHRAIVNRLWWMQRAHPLDGSDVILHKTPFTFDVSVWEIFWWSIAGASVVTLPSGDEKNPERIAERIASHGVTTLHFVPPMLNAFLQYADATGATGRLGSVRRVFASGEALAVSHAELFHRTLGAHAELVNLYGPTEAAVDVTHQPCTGTDTTRAIPIGRPIDNIRLYIRTTAGALAPVGTPGELCIAGTGLARGYLNAPELTAERFVPNPFEPDGRIYRTGDLARWLPDGTIEYLGRIDTQVKVRGYRIELGEIEHVAAGCPGVTACAVTAVEDAAGDKALAAYVVAGPGYDAGALHDRLSAELPSYMVPQYVVEVDAIPTNHNGKRDLKALPDPVAAGAPTDAPAHVAPRTPHEEQLATIWAGVLGVDTVGVHDNFFTHGGDSIKFIAVLARARAAGLRFSFQDLFAHPTVAELAELAATTGATATDDEPAPEAVAPFGLLAPGDRDRLPEGAVDAYPMSQLQIGLIYEAARSDTEGLYHDILSYRIDERLDLALFEEAVRHVARRHAVFRTSFHLDGFSEPVQVVHGAAASPLHVHDLRGLTGSERDAALARFSRDELRAGFTPGAPDLVRVHVHLLGDDAYQYSLSYHDAALDGWSVNTIHRDIFAAYFALLDGGRPAAPEHDVSYRDFIALERQALASATQRDFWLRTMDGAESTQLPRLPLDPEDPDTGALPPVVIHDVALPAGLSEQLVARAHSLRVPVKTLLLAAHTAVLGHLAGTDDVLTGYEHSGRPEAEGGETVPGLFLNTVPFRLRLTDGTWADLARAVYEAESGMLPHRRYPMAEIKRAVGSRDMLFETVFNFTHFHVLKDLGERDGFALVRSVVNAQTEFPFRAEFSQDAVSDEVLLSIHYHPDVLTPGQIARTGASYARALALLATEPDTDRSATTLLDPAEEELLRGFSGREVPLPEGTFVDRFADVVRTAPDRVALQHGTRTLTYAELDRAADRVAGHLARQGVRPGDVVTTLLPRGTAWAVTVLALLKSGAVYLPQDRAYPADRVASVLRRSACRHVVAAREDTATLTALLAERVDGVRVHAYEDAEAAAPTAPPAHRPAPGDLAYVIFTSGSTGEPKGAAIRHSGMLNHLLAKETDLKLTEDDRVAQIATQCFDISVWQLLVAWLNGGATVIYDQERIVEAASFLTALREDRISILEVVPSYLDALLTEVAQRPAALPDLRFNLITGEPLPPALTRRWFAHYDVPLVNAYGPTEASDDVTHHVIDHPVHGSRTPVGRPVLNTGIHVVGPDGALRPVGCYGEICVTGVGVGAGYVNDPERTAAVFVPNTLDDRSTLLYRTGDIGRWLPDGTLDCAGRADHQVKVRGHRIELSEIDGALEKAPGVDGAVTLVREVNGEKRLAAFYCGTAEPDPAAFREALADSLPAYMHPEILVRLDAFPLTANGKVDRKALARHELAAAGQRDLEQPADAQERLVRDLFAGVLGRDPESVGVTDNFFDIGGHSLAAMKVAAASDGRIALRDLLAHPTARRLARALAAADGGAVRDLLADLTAAAGIEVPRPEATVLCIPFAGGSAVSYVDVARELAAGDRPVRVLGVELPGRTATDNRPRVPVEQLAAELADEVRDTVAGPVALLGHCAGSALALALVPALRRRGVEVRGLVAVAKILKSADPADHASNEVVDMTEEQIVDWLVDNTGLDDIAGLGARDRADLARAFQYDTSEATRGFHRALTARAEHRTDVPLTVLYAADDPLARGHEDAAANWALFSDSTRVEVLPDGGHYLNATRPGHVAAAVRAGLGL
ncbi:non-ribosomal peptide synthetase [Streptomyces mashuensis]|uniref:Non-ribosomal peptide synthetase n=1 Tax=Streptomyces mashuensis TaxID=33904 RepID=A0A919BAJ4_9ACTN|nr:non-ribosomal peptide synthetase [Streptomyces mashuensis]GHF71923.1 non-ribosomal peptide synthetase [Streptomyces mashuensis]